MLATEYHAKMMESEVSYSGILSGKIPVAESNGVSQAWE
jgi:hypothetical protein